MAFFDDIKDRVNKAAQSVSSRTKENMEISRLTGEGRNVNTELEALYAQIGRAFVDGETAEALSALGARASELRERLTELERQKMQIKNQNVCPVCGAVMTRDARFCSNCGERMPAPAPEPEPEPEPAPEAPEAAAEEPAPEAEEPASEESGEAE